MLDNKSLQTKMMFAFSFSSVALLLVGTMTYIYVNKTVALYTDVVDSTIPNIHQLNAMQLTEKEVELQVESMVGSQNTVAQATQATKETEKAIVAFEESAKAYENLPFVGAEEDLWRSFRSEHWLPFVEMSRKLLELSRSGDKRSYQTRDEIDEKVYVPARRALAESFTKLKKFQEDLAEQGSASALHATHELKVIMITLIFFGVLIAQLIGFYFSRSLSRSLNGLAGRLGEGAQGVASASKQISNAGSQLSASSTEQAAALQQTVASVDEISAMVNKNAENARKSQEVSQRSHQTATHGKDTVNDMISSIDEISRSNAEITDQIENSNREISEIVKVIAEIGSKTKVINDIVFQTKLLSFNASVEAARAGEHGKGFAVVAEEVGNLAQMSGNAAKEISQMLEGSIQKVEKIVNDTRSKVERLVTSGKTKVEAGTATARRCGEALDQIVGNVTEVNQMINEITTASQEQSQGVLEITKAMSQLDQVTQQNALSSQQSAAASEQLNKQAETLHEMVATLVTTVQGAQNNYARSAMAMSDKELREPAKVFALSAKRNERKATAKTAQLKKTVNSESAPSEDDPRFEEA